MLSYPVESDIIAASRSKLAAGSQPTSRSWGEENNEKVSFSAAITELSRFEQSKPGSSGLLRAKF
jgi:hypothetical protein